MFNKDLHLCLHRNYIVCNLKAFKGPLLSRIQLEVQTLDFHVGLYPLIRTELQLK